MSVQIGGNGQNEYEDRWGNYWAWLIPAMTAVLVTLCIFLWWGLARTRPTATTTSQAATVVAVVPTAAPAATVAAVPTALAVATTIPAAVIQSPGIQVAAAPVFAGAYKFAGTGTPDSTVEVLVNGTSVGKARVGADGKWTLDSTLEAGTVSVVAQALDAAGNVAATANAVSFDVKPTLETPVFTVPTNELVGGPVTLSGTGTPGSQVRVTIDDTDVGTVVVGADGTWDLDTIVSDGERTVVVGAVDDAGKVVVASDPVTVTVAGGLGVTLDAPKEGDVLQSGVNRVSGKGKAGTALEILDGDLVLGTATVGSTGAWSAQVTIADGSASISVREKGSDNILARPVRVQVGTAPVVAAGCGGDIKVACPAWVTRSGGLTLRMRSTPAITADNVIARLPIGTGMNIAEGPQAANGFTWWRVTTRGGNEGWVAGENLVTNPD